MMTTEPVIAVILGGLAALGHLAVTWLRAALTVRGGAFTARVTLPIAVVAPAVCLVVAISLAPPFAWAPILCFSLVRSLTLLHVARS